MAQRSPTEQRARTRAEEEIKKRFPRYVTNMIESQILDEDGRPDWRRVTIEGNALKINNQPKWSETEVKPTAETRERLAPPKAPRQPATKPLAPPRTPRARTNGASRPARPDFPSLDEARARRLQFVAPPPAAPQPARAPGPPPEKELEGPQPRFQRVKHEWLMIPGVVTSGDWERVGLAKTADALARQLKHGLPPEAPMKMHPDVLNLAGVDLPAAEAVVRAPERVTIATETAEKKYPVLLFGRGDITTVVGFREPRQPQIIAAYFTGEALKEYQRTRETSGGGGARKAPGVPKHPRMLKKALTAMGANIEDSATDGKAKVTYKNQDLGTITIEGYTPGGVDSDYQRMRRKIEAIDQRKD